MLKSERCDIKEDFNPNNEILRCLTVFYISINVFEKKQIIKMYTFVGFKNILEQLSPMLVSRLLIFEETTMNEETVMSRIFKHYFDTNRKETGIKTVCYV